MFVGVVACLLVSNLRTIAANQTIYWPDDKPVVRSKSITALALADRLHVVSDTIGTYHALRELLAGKTLVISRKIVNYAFYFERVSRLHVEVVPERRFLAVEIATPLHLHADRYLRLGAGTPLDVILDPAATRYVLVERPGGGLYVILPEAQFLEAGH